MTPASRHMGAVAALGCVICRRFLDAGYVQAEVHHIGDSSEKSDYLTIPLCPEHHRGATGFHGMGERAFNRTYKTSEIELLGMTIEDIAKQRKAA
jgi:hypothetical protein